MTPDSDMIHDYLTHLREIGRAPKTIHTYGTILWAANRELPAGVARAKKDEIAQWLRRPELRTPAARRTYLAALRSYCRWAYEVGHISRDEARLVRRPPQPYSLPNPCTDEQLATILARAPEPYRAWSVIADPYRAAVAPLHRDVVAGSLVVQRRLQWRGHLGCAVVQDQARVLVVQVASGPART